MIKAIRNLKEDMMDIKRGLLGVIVLAAVLTACSAPASTPDTMMAEATPTADPMMKKDAPTAQAMMDMATPTADAMMAQATPTADAMMKKEMPTADAMVAQATPTADVMMVEATPTADAMMDKNAMTAPTWFGAKLTDVNTGKSFQVADFKGKVVLVETMAVWCTTCLQQQGQIQLLHGLLGKQDGLVSLSLDIDPNENSSVLKTYLNSHGFEWMYAVAPIEVAREIGKLYGDQYLNPPSAPMFIIDRKGVVHTLPFGVKSAQDLKVTVDTFLKQGM
jgi:cytochrome oxidase Cu insertion factor (SCO1/SenC/PrrC family)